MSENLLPLQSGNYYHIYNHAVGNELLFKEDTNYQYFLSLTKLHLLPYTEIISYVLMPNHFHFLLRIKEDEGVLEKTCSNQFSKLFNAYSQAYNKLYGRKGTLFNHRFRRKQVKDEVFLRNLVIYINSNPVHHGFCLLPGDWKYFSYKALIGQQNSEINRSVVISLFDNLDNLKFCLNNGIDDIDSDLSFE